MDKTDLDQRYLQYIGENLKKRILAEYPSIESFAIEIESTRQTINLIIRGKREPKLFTLIAICRELNITITELIGE